jgi:hypothetical protein
VLRMLHFQANHRYPANPHILANLQRATGVTY